MQDELAHPKKYTDIIIPLVSIYDLPEGVAVSLSLRPCALPVFSYFARCLALDSEFEPAEQSLWLAFFFFSFFQSILSRMTDDTITYSSSLSTSCTVSAHCSRSHTFFYTVITVRRPTR